MTELAAENSLFSKGKSDENFFSYCVVLKVHLLTTKLKGLINFLLLSISQLIVSLASTQNYRLTKKPANLKEQSHEMDKFSKVFVQYLLYGR